MTGVCILDARVVDRREILIINGRLCRGARLQVEFRLLSGISTFEIRIARVTVSNYFAFDIKHRCGR